MKKIEADIKKHALEEYPKECVGYVSGGKYHRLKNVANYPEKMYQLSIEDKFKIFGLGKELTALVHSHPVLDNRPSEKDLASQKATKLAFWIIGTDGKTTTEIKEIA